MSGPLAALSHDASARDGIGGNNPPAGYARTCLECGEPYEALKAWGGFCCRGHRSAWNARRAQRGAIVYDLLMACRFERGPAKLMRVWTLLCRAAAEFRAEDWHERDGRRSWRRPRTVIAEQPWLLAQVLVRRRPKVRAQ